MNDDDALANRTVRYHEIEVRELDREVSGPPMIGMLSVSFAAGVLFGLCLALTRVTGPVATLAIGWCFALAVLAIEAALYSTCRARSRPFRYPALRWSTIGPMS